MIPAILSVGFVIYLYQSLQETPEASVSGATGDASDAQANELVARLKSLESRVEQLAGDYDSQNQGDI